MNQQPHLSTTTVLTKAEKLEQPTVDQSVIDAVKASGGSHPRKLRDIINNHTPDTEQGPTANDPTPQIERDYGLDEDGERAV